MSVIRSTVTFLFLVLGLNSALALPGEGVDSESVVRQGNKTFSIEEVISAAKEQRQMAIAMCEGVRDEVVTEQLKDLMKVGLYNYCDQYTSQDRFCGCVKETTYENEITKKDIEEWDKHKISMIKRNIALNSFKAIKKYKEATFRNIVNLPNFIEGNKFNTKSAITKCGSSLALKESVSPICSESDLAEMNNSFSLALEDCESCKGMDIDSMPKGLKGRDNRTPGEDFLHFPTYWIEKEYVEKDRKDEFLLDGLNKALPANKSRYKSMGDFQYRELVENIASKINDKWKGRTDDNYYLNIGPVDKVQKIKNAAFIMSLNQHFLFKDLPGFPKKSTNMKTGKMLQQDVNEYVDILSRAVPDGIFDKRELSVGDIAKYLERYLESEHAKRMNNSCEELIEVLKKSCSAISPENLKFSRKADTDTIEKIRSEFYPKDKFKVDQLYCHSSKRGPMKGESGIFESKLLSLDQEELSKLDLSSGVDIAVSESLASGRRNIAVTVNVTDDDIFKYSYKSKPKSTDEIFDDVMNQHSKSNDDSSSYSSFQNGFMSRTKDEELSFEMPMSIEEMKNSMIYRAKKISESLIDVDELENPVIEMPKVIQTDLTESIKNAAEDIIQSAGDIEQQDIAKESDTKLVSAENTQSTDGEYDNSMFEKSQNSNLSENPTGEKFGEIPQNTNMNYNLSNRGLNSQSFARNRMNESQFIKEPTSEELMENRIRELEAKLSSQNSIDEAIKEKDSAVDVNPSKNSFSKAEEKSEDSLELNKLKVELEKMKLQIAKNELEAKKKEQSIAQASKQAPVASSSNMIPSPLSSNVTKALSSKPKRSNTDSSISKPAVQSQSSPTSSSQSISSSSETTSTATRTNTPTSRSSTTGALLTATEIGDNQLQGPQGNIVSYQSFSDISTADQNELEKLYLEFGSQLVTQGGSEILLEKDESTGEIKVLEKKNEPLLSEEEKVNKRSPAAIEESLEDKKSRKRFSLQEFNQIIDNGVKKE